MPIASGGIPIRHGTAVGPVSGSVIGPGHNGRANSRYSRRYRHRDCWPGPHRMGNRYQEPNPGSATAAAPCPGLARAEAVILAMTPGHDRACRSEEATGMIVSVRRTAIIAALCLLAVPAAPAPECFGEFRLGCSWRSRGRLRNGWLPGDIRPHGARSAAFFRPWQRRCSTREGPFPCAS